jgi:Zn-finger nucleic acid-binding protein
MQCPKCKRSMIVLEVQEIEIDHCLECGGVWLDGGELELLLEGAEERDALLSSMAIDTATSEKKIKCPLCSKKMDKVLCGTGTKVLIDRCSANDGIWFDKGELNEIMEMGVFHGDTRVYDILNSIFREKK